MTTMMKGTQKRGLMTLNKKQIQKIMRKSGQAYVPADKLPYKGRVAETYLRKKIYRLEDRAAHDEYQLIKAAYRDIRNEALDLALRQNIERLSLGDSASIVWRRDLINYIDTRLRLLASDIALRAYEHANTAYRAGYYGRLWLLDMITPSTWHPAVRRLNPSKTAQAILHPGLMEAIDAQSYFQTGQEWRETYHQVWDTASIQIKRALTSAQSDELTIGQSVQLLAKQLGITERPTARTSATFHKSQLQTRTSVMRASNHGAAQAYHEQQDFLVGVLWISSRDSRVCPTCNHYDGHIFLINSLIGISLFGLPPDGSHAGCRCTFVPILLPGFGDGEDEPLDSFEDWIDEIGLFDELDDFFSDSQLDSTLL